MTNARRWPWLLAGFFALVYGALSVTRHVRMLTTGYDLGIFEQAVRAYAHLRAPVAELKGPGYNLLGDHFHPVLVLLAPFYRLAPSPVTLLVAQALLLAVSIVPITRLAIGRLGSRAGIAVGVAYGLSWGIQQAVVFDFHEICFAVPLMAFCLERLAAGRWHPAVAWALPLLLVKEDLPATVAAIGAYLFLKGQRRLGVAVVAIAAVAGMLILTVAIPAANPGGAYDYLGRVEPGEQNPFIRLLTPGTKWLTMLWLLLPTAFVALRSPLLLIAAPTVAWRFWSTTESHWSIHYHYSAILMPVIFAAFVDGLDRMRDSARAPVRWWRTAAIPVVLLVALGGLAWNQPLRTLAVPKTWQVSEEVHEKRRILAMIPDGADVAAGNQLAPQLTGRARVFLFPMQPSENLRPEWVVVLDPPGPSPILEVVERTAILALPARGYHEVARAGKVILYRLSP